MSTQVHPDEKHLASSAASAGDSVVAASTTSASSIKGNMSSASSSTSISISKDKDIDHRTIQELADAVHKKNGLWSSAFNEGVATGGEHCYSQLDATSFSVRGPSYLEDRIKVDSEISMFDLMHVEMVRSNDRIGNLAARSGSWLRSARAAGDSRYYFVIVYVTPAPPYLYLIFYFAVQPERVGANSHFSSLWKRFTASGPEGEAFRTERWKVIPRVSEGSWIVQNAVGSKPALLAQKLTHTWIICEEGGETLDEGGRPQPRRRGRSNSPGDGISSRRSMSSDKGSATGAGGDGSGVEAVGHEDVACGSLPAMWNRGNSGLVTQHGPGPYLESDCDVASSSMAFVLVSLLQSYAKYLVIDLAFTIEPREEECLPEVVIGCLRLSRINMDLCPMITAAPEDFVLGSATDHRSQQQQQTRSDE
jgi:hypothetical protein